MALIDKGKENVAFICKGVYIELLVKELGTDPDGKSDNRDTYNVHDIDDWIIINELQGFLQKHFKLKVSQDNKVLPSMYWISHLHKKSQKSYIYRSISDIIIEAPD